MKINEWIIEADLTSMQAAMELRTITSVDLVEAYLLRIQENDPIIHSILDVNPDALHIAASLDKEREEKGSRGLLHGIPIL